MDEAASVAGLLGSKGNFATVEEAGKSDRLLAVTGTGTAFARLALLLGRSTLGAPEVLASCLKKDGAKVFGERTPGFGVERTRFPLKQGGAVELVSKRWVGLGGEKLDRQGVAPDQVLKVADTEDALTKVLTALATPAPKHEASKPEGAPLPGPATGPAPVPPKVPIR
jgi:C-terminal processing protease CtpA/Prc